MIWADEMNPVPTLAVFFTNQSVIAANELPIEINLCCIGHVAGIAPENIEGNIEENLAVIKVPRATGL